MKQPSFEELLENYGVLAGIEKQIFPGKSGVEFVRYRFGRDPLRGYFISRSEAESILREVYSQNS